MAAKRFLRYVTGRIQEIVATVVSAGAANDGDIVALDATGKLDLSVLPTGLGPDTKSLVADEALNAGDFVNVFEFGGVAKVRKADASVAGKEAHGFVLAAVAAAASATVYFEGTNNQRAGLTVGARYYLSAVTPGGIVTVPPAGTGNVVQFVGVSVSATEVAFEPTDGIVLA